MHSHQDQYEHHSTLRDSLIKLKVTDLFERVQIKKALPMFRPLHAALTILLVTALPLTSYAADPCATVDQRLTHDLKIQFAPLIAKSFEGNVKSSKIDIDSIMRSGTWTIVHAFTPVSDPGYFFFDSSTGDNVFKDVWGGIAEKGEAPEIARWARSLGANKAISACFANTVAVVE